MASLWLEHLAGPMALLLTGSIVITTNATGKQQFELSLCQFYCVQ